MNKIMWDNAWCEPVLITYNRKAHVQATLEAFFTHAAYGMTFHVLDNASDDGTQALVEEWQTRWPQLRYHRNTRNIGGNANILRALELTDAEYVWVIGDDDQWHMQAFEHLMPVLHEKKADLIRLGWLVSDAFAGHYEKATTIAQKEHLFFASLSMISATIIRREIMLKSLPSAYANIAFSYPQLVPCIVAFEERPLQVYSMPMPLLTHTPNMDPGYFRGDLEWYVAWFQTGRFFKARQHQEHFIAEAVRYMIRPRVHAGAEWLWLLKVALNAKAHGLSQAAYLGELFVCGVGWRGRIVGVMIVYALFPKTLAMWVRRLYYRMIKKNLQPLRYDRSRL